MNGEQQIDERQGGSTRSAVKALTGATDVELDELGGFSDALSAMPVEPDLSTLPEVQHRIEGGRFVCPGDAGSRCHQYPGCDCESWPCRHEYVAHDECWIKPWIDVTDLCDSYARREHDDLLRDGDFPDGDVLWSWEGDYVLWEYVTDMAGELSAGEWCVDCPECYDRAAHQVNAPCGKTHVCPECTADRPSDD